MQYRLRCFLFPTHSLIIPTLIKWISFEFLKGFCRLTQLSYGDSGAINNLGSIFYYGLWIAIVCIGLAGLMICRRWVRPIYHYLKKVFLFNAIIRYWLEGYIEIFLSSFITLFNVSFIIIRYSCVLIIPPILLIH